MKPELFDVVELLVDLPESNLCVGEQGAIVECFNGGKYEVEFANQYGETTAICTLNSEQFRVVWQAKTKSKVGAAPTEAS
jgi:hypothetical protein